MTDLDELIVFPPEPCETCDSGITSMRCFDGVRRCRNCVMYFAALEGLDGPMPEPAEESTAPRTIKRRPAADSADSLF